MLSKLCCALAMLFALLPARAEDITLTNGEWLPFLSEHLAHYGVMSRIVSEAFALEGVTVHYIFRPWPRALAEARNGRAQGSVVWSGGSPGSVRSRDFLFSDVLFEDQSVFFHRKDLDFQWTSDTDLLKYRVGGVAGYEYKFESVPGLRVDRASSDELSMRKLLAGRIDIFPSSLDVGMYVLHTRVSAEDAQRITYSKGANLSTRYHLILPRGQAGSARLLALFNKGLRKLKDSGHYARYMADLAAGKY